MTTIQGLTSTGGTTQTSGAKKKGGHKAAPKKGAPSVNANSQKVVTPPTTKIAGGLNYQA